MSDWGLDTFTEFGAPLPPDPRATVSSSLDYRLQDCLMYLTKQFGPNRFSLT